jgi:hypothetical protein
MNEIMQTPEDDRRRKKIILKSLRPQDLDLEPSTLPLDPREQKKVEKKLLKEIKKNIDILNEPTH